MRASARDLARTTTLGDAMSTGWRQFALGAAALCGVILGTAQPARAQVTTGNIVGNVKDQTGATLPGAVVVATHVPTGTVYQSVTDKDGRYQVLEVRVGGPYTVKVSLSGFKDGVESDVNVKLGEDREVSFKLELKTVSENVVVSAPAIDTAQPGAVANLSADQAASIPSIQRSLFDQVQVNPYIVGYVTNGNGQLSISIAGRNNRYNTSRSTARSTTTSSDCRARARLRARRIRSPSASMPSRNTSC